jgi:CSLREA domain-containing protein
MFAKRPMICLVFTSILLISLFFTSLGTTPAYAAGITVNTAVDEIDTNGLCSLREAITNANSNTATYPDCAAGSGIDTISFAGNHTITLAGVHLPQIFSEIIINGKGAANTIIQANASPNTATYRIFYVTGSLTLNNLTLRHGRCNGGCNSGFLSNAGGAIYNDGGILTVTNSTISGNSAESGGAILNWGGTLSVTNSSFTFNNALSGGALHNIQTTAVVTNSTISGNNAEQIGGGIYNYSGNLTITNSTFSGNYAANTGGGIYSSAGAEEDTVTITNSTLFGNTATKGGGIYNNGYLWIENGTLSGNTAEDYGGGILNEWSLTVTSSTFSGNSASNRAGGIYNEGDLTVTSSTLSGSSAINGGGVYNVGNLSVTSSTLSGNSAINGGGIANEGSLIVTNSTLSGNSATTAGGGIANGGYLLALNSTLSGNSASNGGGIINYTTLNYANTIIANSTSGGDCYNDGGTMGLNNTNLVENGSCSATLSGDPKLGALANNGGPTQTMALLAGSPAIDAGNNAVCSADPDNLDQRGVTRPQGSRCDIGAYEAGGIKVIVSTTELGAYALAPMESTRASFPGVNDGPIQLINKNGEPLIAAERVIYKVNGVNTSFTEMMGLPNGQLSATYWFPWYNNADLDTQLRFGNVSGSTATVRLYIGGTEKTSGCTSSPSLPYPYVLAPFASIRVSCASVNNGPVKIQSTGDIVAAERVIYKVNGVKTSFTEMMGLPAEQLSTTYWFPWYNNADLDTQLRFGNVSGSTATVRLYIGGVEKTSGCTSSPSLPYPYVLANGASIRVSCAGANNGPVKIQSTGNIVAAERVIYKVNGTNTSFSEMMGLPNHLLETTYWLPWYNNADLDTQLRFGNVSGVPATVRLYIGGVEKTSGCTSSPSLPYPYVLANGASIRVSCAGVNNGPVKIHSTGRIVAAERVIYKVNGTNTSFTEMMGLPNDLLDMTYWFPWYNNADLDTQLRFGVP